MTNLVDLEEWRTLPSNHRYMVSSFGRVRNAYKVMKPRLGYKDYWKLGIWNDTKRRTVYLHALIAEAFVGPRPSGAVCRHIDGDKNNNRATNIAYGTVKENRADMLRHGRAPIGERHGCAKLTREQVLLIRRLYEQRANRLWGVNALAAKFGVHRNLIAKITKGQIWQSI